MNATDLLLGVLTGGKNSVSELPSFAAQPGTEDRETFRKTLDQLLERVNNRNNAPQQMFAAKHSISGNPAFGFKADVNVRADSNAGAERPPAVLNQTDAAQTQRAERNSPMGRRADAAAASTAVSAQERTGEEVSPDRADNTQGAQSTSQSAQASKPETDEAEPVQLLDSTPAEDKATDATPEQQILDLLAKLLLLIAQQNVELSADQTGNAQAGIEGIPTLAGSDALKELLALLQETVGADATNASSLNIELTVGKDSQLYRLLQELMKSDASALKDAQLLLKVSDTQALIVPLNALTEGTTANEEGALTANLQLADDSQGETEVFTLSLTAKDLQNASVTDPAKLKLPEAPLLLIVPAKGDGDNAQQLLAQLDVKAAAIQAQLTDATPATADTETPLPKVVVPLVPEGTDQKTAQQVATSKSMFLTSDQYMDALKASTLLEEAARALQTRKATGEPGLSGDRTLMNLFEQWIENKQVQAFTVNRAEFKDLAGDMQQQAKNAETEAMKSQPRLFQPAVTGDISDVGGRIQFLSRPAFDTTQAQQVLNNAPAHNPARPDMSQQVMRQVMDQFNIAYMNGRDGEVRIFIRPENLGDLRLRIQTDGDVVTAKFVAASQQVKEIIEASLNQLRDVLTQQGLKVGKMVVTLDSGNHGQTGEQQKSDDRGGSSTAYGTPAEAAGAYEDSSYMNTDFLYGAEASRTLLSSRINYFA